MVLAYGFAAGFVLGVVRFEIASSNVSLFGSDASFSRFEWWFNS